MRNQVHQVSLEIIDLSINNHLWTLNQFIIYGSHSLYYFFSNFPSTASTVFLIWIWVLQYKKLLDIEVAEKYL